MLSGTWENRRKQNMETYEHDRYPENYFYLPRNFLGAGIFVQRWKSRHDLQEIDSHRFRGSQQDRFLARQAHHLRLIQEPIIRPNATIPVFRVMVSYWNTSNTFYVFLTTVIQSENLWTEWKRKMNEMKSLQIVSGKMNWLPGHERRILTGGSASMLVQELQI